MMNMLIQLDEKRVLEEKICSLKEMWRLIDKRFENNFTKDILLDGSAYYVCNPTKDYWLACMLAVDYLEKQKWFAMYCSKWIWFDDDDDDELPFQEIDVLARRRKNNPMFAQYAPKEDKK